MLHLITGGSGSGKSVYAENCILKLGLKERIYIATMYPFDEESHRRIARHREMRKEKNFQTIECFTGLKSLELPPDSNVLLECMSNLTANEIYQQDGAGEHTVREILEGVRHLRDHCANLVIVSNEIFSDGMDYDAETMRYQRYLGDINCQIAAWADCVTEVVYGIPITIKGESLQYETTD
ncbi:bifunctional adenosylcobinamide kinase/adenosylcobinamide-phosphate guanylyltransferase [Ruminococcus sp. OA3]|uniref:bifunctional adenosylcobinamide kinase/adenosylcobinamide-phosphate guanylyltransferase n=1 Tax=Ruminococcus sp. OA3 TaxID=2914164 RepID=UPI001F067CC8|nr:bifunctional adenosylcobinamide kinase/adenosylcobinamide-phosphate guanylyltransferase [Ruminococcus sp. OA3]MCH1983637.1 bifunctional adenosylcobinamide kinase/adenosylcobinamide-phosphate guanylyltransferase [Ruminococcus sp. OA3]